MSNLKEKIKIANLIGIPKSELSKKITDLSNKLRNEKNPEVIEIHKKDMNLIRIIIDNYHIYNQVRK